MALPIAPTPVLLGKYAEQFIRRLKEHGNIPAHLIPTPKLDSALEEVRKKVHKLEVANV